MYSPESTLQYLVQALYWRASSVTVKQVMTNTTTQSQIAPLRCGWHDVLTRCVSLMHNLASPSIRVDHADSLVDFVVPDCLFVIYNYITTITALCGFAVVSVNPSTRSDSSNRRCRWGVLARRSGDLFW